MAIDISSTTRRAVYTGSSGVGPYPFNFEVLTQTDIAVYFNTTELTLTTDYTVTVDADGTGSVTIVTGTNVPSTPTASDRITIVGDRTIERTTDFTTGGPLFATSLNDEFDSQTIFVQQVLEQSDRSLRAPNTDPTTIDMTLPLNTIRANKTLAFDADGNPTTGELVGNWRGDWAAGTEYTKRDLIKDTTNNNVYICTVAHTSSGSLPLTSNADYTKWDLMVDAASATAAQLAAEAAQTAAETAETNAETAQTAAELAETNAETAQTAAEAAQTAAETAQTGAETAETNAETAQTAAEAAQAAAEAVFDNFDDAYLGAKASDPTLDNDGDALADGALYFDTTNNVMKVYDLGTTTWYQLTPTVSNQTNINTVAGIASDVTAVAAIDTDVTTVAGINTDVTAVAADSTDIGTVAGISANVTTVAGIASDVTTVAADGTDIGTVAGISSDVTTVAGVSSNVTTVAGNTTNINTVASNNSNVTTVASNITNVNTVATNVTDVVTFATTYLGAQSSAPSTSTTGALYYDTVAEQLYIWDGSAWDEAAFNTTGAVTSFNTRTGAITLSAADVNTALGSDAVLDSDIGVTVEAYDATILKDADIGVTVEAYDATILKDADIGVTVEAYDATILKDADIGVNVEAYDATILKDADIGVTVQGYDADTAKYDDTTANFTGTLQNGGSNVLVDSDIHSTVGTPNIDPVGTKTASYTLTTSDVGKYVRLSAGGSIIIPDATFSEGDVVSIHNSTTGDVTITCSITAAYIAGDNTNVSSVTLATRGVATVLFIAGTYCVITGNVS